MKITNHKLCQFIVKKFLKDKPNWGKEIKIAQKLIKIYKNNYTYWNNIKDIKLPSLAWFLTDDGKKYLNIQNKISNLNIKNINKIPILKEKVGIDKNICKKPKTLLEFIRYGKKT